MQVLEKSLEPATPSSPPPQPCRCENDAVKILEKSPSKEEPIPTSPPNSCHPATPPLEISGQERRRMGRERKKREKKSESVLMYALKHHMVAIIVL
jgi:hypothetical protein